MMDLISLGVKQCDAIFKVKITQECFLWENQADFSNFIYCLQY